MRAWCIWCESGDKPNLKGYYWIHSDCANKLMDVKADLVSVKEMFLGLHNRNKEDNDKVKVIFKFIKDSEEFERKWNNIKSLIEV